MQLRAIVPGRIATALTIAAAVSLSVLSLLTAGASPARASATVIPAAASKGSAEVEAISCPSAGNCTAGGWYLDSAFHTQAFVVTEKNGSWRNAVELPGSAALNTGKDAQVESISCPSAGNCGATGAYTRDVSGQRLPLPFLATEKNGTWGKPQAVKGTPAEGGFVRSGQISCKSPGNCSTYVTYEPDSETIYSSVVSEKNGVWGTAKKLGVALKSLSCGSPGNCSAGGSSSTGPIVISEKNGTWGKPENVPGIARKAGDNPLFGGPAVGAVSCSSGGNCAAVGSFVSGDEAKPFVVTEKNGVWGKAAQVPGLAAITHGGSGLDAVSCASTGNCTAGGTYVSGLSGGDTINEAFVVNEKNGAWGKAEEVPGIAALNVVFPDYGADAVVNSVSCKSAGNCSAGGAYMNAAYEYEAFVVSEKNGVWGKAEEVPGTGALNAGANDISGGLGTVSCGSAGNCSGAGAYTDGSGHAQAFVVNQKSGAWGKALVVPDTLSLENSKQ